jgi:LPPG:FO 2-phospho-L-lactate transferase
VVVNTGDDFTHFGLAISPDLDTQLYTLAGLVNPETGWGRKDETWTFMDRLATLGGPTWFRLGDGDLALHAERTRRLAAGDSLSRITADFAAAHGLAAALLPMSDDPVRTFLDTEDGRLSMQDYFVRHRCRPVVRRISYAGAAVATAAPGVLAALADPALAAVVLCPSNPYLSIDPILAVPGIRKALAGLHVPVVAVSPIVGGAAVKGPLAKLMVEFGIPVSPRSIAAHYAGLIDGLVMDERDAPQARDIDVPCHVTDTVMRNAARRQNLARACLDLAATLARRPTAKRLAA